MTALDPFLRQRYLGRRVMITGMTGFKGSWLAVWLRELGAVVHGFSLPATLPSNYSLCQLDQRLPTTYGDITEPEPLMQAMQAVKPELVFHLAAQPIVLAGYRHPRETFNVNTQGTVNVLDAIRQTDSVRAAVLVTTDKVYENHERQAGYCESDRLGGYDPYSASKAMAELAIASYRQAFFNLTDYQRHRVALASVRAGNIIGGGDFSEARLVVDAVNALIRGECIPIRNPDYVRPWMYVLDALSGYLLVGARMLEEDVSTSDAFNFGPQESHGVTAAQVAEKMIQLWGEGTWHHVDPHAPRPKETKVLRLNWEKAAATLDWQPRFSLDQALACVIEYARSYAAHLRDPHGSSDFYPLCARMIAEYSR